jgi:hypothetical protein
MALLAEWQYRDRFTCKPLYEVNGTNPSHLPKSTVSQYYLSAACSWVENFIESTAAAKGGASKVSGFANRSAAKLLGPIN